jgi:dTDP-L-rhamnose 4-epimerase
MSKRTLLITGSSGFIGNHVVEEALKNGYKVKGLDLNANVNPAIEFIKGDIRDKSTVSKAVEEVDFIIYLAG